MRRIFTLLGCGLLFLSFAAAQTVSNTGSITGLVTDASGAVIAGASVTLSDPATASTWQRTSNGAGRFAFPSQPVGAYRLQVTQNGFKTAELSTLLVSVGQTTSVEVRMQPGAAAESVTVAGATPLLRPDESSLSTVVSRSLLDAVPLSGRRFTDFALLSPNASPDGQMGLVSFAGQQGGEDTGYANGNSANSFTLDGASATSNYFGDARGGTRTPYVFGENAIEEFQVAVTPYSAAYGGGATGFVNTVTRSGSDQFHGNAFYYNRNSGTGANDAVDKASGIPRPVNVLQQFGGSLGGPIRRQRAWFFADYEQQRQKNPISVVNEDFADVDQTSFGVPDGVALPAPNGPLPVPGFASAPDPANPEYLQQVANALGAIQSNLGTHSRFRNDLALFTRLDWQTGAADRFSLSLNLNRFNSPNGEITASQTPLFGISTLANSYLRDYQASLNWTHSASGSLLNEFHASFSRDDQYSTPTGLVDPKLPSILLNAPGTLQLGNAGFAGGRTNEAQWQLAERVNLLHGRHNLKFGVEFSRTHAADESFGGFDPDAQRQNGTFRGTYQFASLSNFALGIYDSFFQSSGNPNFAFNVPFFGVFAQDSWHLTPRLTLDLGVREDFQVYPQPKANPAFPLTGQFPNQYQRLAPRLGFAWQASPRTVVRGGFGLFYENFNGLNYRNSVISNGLATQQSSAVTEYNPDLAPNQQAASVGDEGKFGPAFPNQINDPALFSASPDISLVDPHFKFPYILQGSLQIEREILPDTTVSVGTLWTHGVHLISSSAYDANLIAPAGATTYIVCPPGTTVLPCTGRQIVAPTLDSSLLQEGAINPALGQINELISPGQNHYNSFFAQAQRRPRHGLGFQASYTFARNIMLNGVDFNNQFDFRNTHGPYLLDQRHRLTFAAFYQPEFGQHLNSPALRGLLSHWTLSAVGQFASGRPYAALLTGACTESDPAACSGGVDGEGDAGSSVNNSAANQSTANSALGINGSAPSPAVGINSFYGPWTQQVDVSLARRFRLSDRQSLSLQVQAFNVMNHANFYVQNGNGVNAQQYQPVGSTCGDGTTLNQTCYLLPNPGFGTLQTINALNGARVFQFALKYSF